MVLPIFFVWLEVMFHIFAFHEFGKAVFLPVCFALAFGFLLSFVSGFFRSKGYKILVWVSMTLGTVLFIVQAVYFTIFKTFLTLGLMLGNAGDATEFWKEGLHGLWKTLPAVILMALPFIAFAFLCKRGVRKKHIDVNIQIGTIACALLFYSLAMVNIRSEANEKSGLYELFAKEWQIDRGVQSFGVLVGFAEDVKSTITYKDDVGNNNEYVGLPSMGLKPTEVVKPTEPEVTLAPEQTPTPTPTPIDTSPNQLPIDFAELAKNEKDDNVKKIHEYMSQSVPTNKNAYTGMFEGYNLIMMTCEAFSPWAIDKDLTPTLYKLVHEGFEFTNFYTPSWITSTSDGEYVACTGLYPDLHKNNSFRRTSKNAMPLCFGHVFTKLGYSARAYHDNTYTYYGRDKSHPNMGYIYKAVGNGLDIKKSWPESDLEMMQVSIPDYINDEKFHAYYMTVSGHLQYTFTDNSMSAKNKELVKDLPYSVPAKAYIACNIELDRAMEYLLSELEKAGKLENTLIVMSADHYPYGLTQEQIEELEGGKVDKTFELYRNHLVMWSGSMKEPVKVDKLCSSVDIIPTLYNLFGIPYDSRLFSGADIFSDAASLVIFKTGSFITDYCKYDAGTRKVTMIADVELPDNYISTVKDIVATRLNIARGILNHNYYSYIQKYLP